MPSPVTRNAAPRAMTGIAHEKAIVSRGTARITRLKQAAATLAGAARMLANDELSGPDLEDMAENKRGQHSSEQQDAAEFLLANPELLRLANRIAQRQGLDNPERSRGARAQVLDLLSLLDAFDVLDHLDPSGRLSRMAMQWLQPSAAAGRGGPCLGCRQAASLMRNLLPDREHLTRGQLFEMAHGSSKRAASAAMALLREMGKGPNRAHLVPGSYIANMAHPAIRGARDLVARDMKKRGESAVSDTDMRKRAEDSSLPADERKAYADLVKAYGQGKAPAANATTSTAPPLRALRG